MSDSLFREGGPHNIKRTGPDTYEMSVALPADIQGLVGRECTRTDCSPGYFKVKPGTGLTSQAVAYCPYCRTAGTPSSFHTQAQHRYARDVMMREASAGVDAMLRKALGLGPGGRKKIGGGMLSIEMSLKSSPSRPVTRPIEEELRRDLVCDKCGLVHAVFGLATWCPDCATDLFLLHVGAELEVTRKILGAVNERRLTLGARVAARDIENALEDIVSIFETVLKLITRKVLIARGVSADEADSVLERKVRNSYQSVERAEEVFLEHAGVPLFAQVSADERNELRTVFEKRHPITHNLGVIDRKYLARAQTGELAGRDIRVTAGEVLGIIHIVETVVANAYRNTRGADS